MRLDFTGPAGRLEGLLDEPAATPRAAVVFAHPYPPDGGTMHTKAVFQGAKGLVRIGCAVLRFNFRGVGASEGTFDEGRGEMQDFELVAPPRTGPAFPPGPGGEPNPDAPPPPPESALRRPVKRYRRAL